MHWILVHIEVDFLDELRWEDNMRATVRIVVIKAGRTSLTMTESIESQDGRTVSRAQSVIALWDPAEHRTRALDSQQRAALAALGR